VQLPQSTVSRHLKVLSDQKWVTSRRLATTRLYRMLPDELESGARQMWLLAREQTVGWATLQQDELRLQRRLRERDIDSQEFFAGAAGEWDRLRNDLYGTGFTSAALLALLPRELVVADLGCGSGAVLEQLAPHVKRAMGVDNNAAMLKAARKRTSELSNVEVRKGELQQLPIEDGSVDAALLLLVLTYVMDVQAPVREAARILKPGGRVVVVDLLPHDRDDFRRQLGQLHAGFAPSAIQSALLTNGFTTAVVRPLAPEPEAKGPALFLAIGQR
jgi:ArsR family transcriptional regulator